MDKPSDLETAMILVVDALREMNQGQRQRLLIMDSQLRVLDEFAGRLERLEQRFEAVLHDYRAHCRICARLNILCSNVGTKDKGPPSDDEEKDINQKLTDWH
jgi:hypothetical protein